MPVVPNLALIAALSDNGVIGRDNALPWRMPADLAHFKRLTLDKPIIMGRKTWESLPGLLPRRRHIVVTRNPGYVADGAEIAHSPEQAIALAGQEGEIMLVGGAGLYARMLPMVARMYLTYIHTEVPGDAWFPAFDRREWRERGHERQPADDRNPYDYSFVELERI
ncbi:MAG: dihydrofolate reductase [Gammaproteobacteria bacterium]|nr:dihydrofolate reductase [Gammaproteobacteria bacterium]